MTQMTVKGILSYPNLFQPKTFSEDQKPKYSASLLIHKEDPQLKELYQVQNIEKANGFPSGFPINGKVFLKDCKDQYPEDTSLAPYMMLNCSARIENKPCVVDINLQPILDPALVYPGAEVWMQFNTFAFSHPMNKGVSASLNGILLTGNEGPLGRLDTRPSVEQMFASVINQPGNGTQAPPNPQQTPVPAPPSVKDITRPTELIMTAAANGSTYEQYKQAGWSDDQMIAQGIAQRPSFA